MRNFIGWLRKVVFGKPHEWGPWNDIDLLGLEQTRRCTTCGLVQYQFLYFSGWKSTTVGSKCK